jgi:hypothetical protein
MVNMIMARLQTDERLANDALDESLIGRGVYTPRGPEGVGAGARVDLGTQFERQEQDTSLQAAQQYADIAAGRSNAQLGYNQGLMEALLASAQNAVANPNMRQPFAGSGRAGYGPNVGQGGGGGGGGGRGGLRQGRGRRARRGRR